MDYYLNRAYFAFIAIALLALVFAGFSRPTVATVVVEKLVTREVPAPPSSCYAVCPYCNRLLVAYPSAATGIVKAKGATDESNASFPTRRVEPAPGQSVRPDRHPAHDPLRGGVGATPIQAKSRPDPRAGGP